MYLAAERSTNATYVDYTDAICPGTTCPLVIGHVVIHRAGDHITATYAATVASQLNPEIEQVLARAGSR